MARIRSIKPEFFSSEQIAECSMIARLLFIGMWNFCDDGGVHRASLKRLKMEIFPADEITLQEVERLVGELITQGLLGEFEHENERYWFVTGWKHQKIERPSYKYPQPDSPNVRRMIDDQSPPEGKGREGSRSLGVEGKGMEGAAPAALHSDDPVYKSDEDTCRLQLRQWGATPEEIDRAFEDLTIRGKPEKRRVKGYVQTIINGYREEATGVAVGPSKRGPAQGKTFAEMAELELESIRRLGI